MVFASFALAQQGAGESTIRLRLQADISTLDPAHVGQSTDHAVSLLVYNGLVRYAAGNLDVVPDLATSWDISEDGTVYTFYLREDVQWHKGYGELTASDVVYSINRIRDDATASRFQQDLNIVQSVRAIDDYTVEFVLQAAFADFIPGVLAFRPGWIVNEQAILERGDAYGVDPIGTGPYVFESWSRSNQVRLSRNPDYFEPVDIDNVVFRIIPDDSVAELALRTGEVDAAYLFEGEPGARLVRYAETTDSLHAEAVPGYRTQWVAFNLDRPAIADPRVRMAIIHALDKEAAVESVYGVLGIPASSIFNPVVPGVIDPNPFPYNPDRARELLAEAGYPNGISIDVLVIPSIGWPELATVFEDMWRQVGIRANLILRERAVYDQLARGDAYDVHAQHITRATASQYAAFLFGPNSPFPNTTRYAGADDLVEAANNETDPITRNQIWAEFQNRALVEDIAGFGVSNLGYVLGWRSNVSGMELMYQDAYPVFQMSIE